MVQCQKKFTGKTLVQHLSTITINTIDANKGIMFRVSIVQNIYCITTKAFYNAKCYMFRIDKVVKSVKEKQIKEKNYSSNTIIDGNSRPLVIIDRH